MGKKSIHFMSQRLNWQTPKSVYEKLNTEFHFDLDPCPAKNPPMWMKFRRGGGMGWNGLVDSWGKCNFVNPPYGREIGKWLKKGYEESLLGKTVVFLIPSRTDTKWWHEYVMKASEIRFIQGRLKFGNAANSAPFPSCIVIFVNT